MSKFKRSALISLICLMGVVFSGWISFSRTPQPFVRLTTNPVISEIRPFEAEANRPQSPVQIALQAVDEAGRPLENVNMRLQILTKPKTPWLTTDFPISEGTTLLDMEAPAPKGELQIQQMLPIRGAYKLLVDVTPITPNAFAPIQQTLRLSVSESWLKYQNFGVMVAILLAAGLVGGWVIGSKQSMQSGETVPERVRLLLSGMIVVAIAVLLFVNVSAEFAQSHTSMAMSHETEDAPPSKYPATLQSQGLEMKLSGDLNATVGKLASFQVNVTDTQTGQPAKDIVLKVTTKPEEDEWVAFAYQAAPDSAGRFAWQQQFFDGAPHSIEVEVAPQSDSPRQFQPFQVAQNIPVEGVAPPMFVRLISLTYLTGIVGIGLLLGLWLQRRRTQQSSSPTWKRNFS